MTFNRIPANAPRCPYHNSFHRDGAMRTDGNLGDAADRYDHRADDDYYSQAGALFRLIDANQKQKLIGNIAASISKVPEDIIAKQLEHFYHADPAYAAAVVSALNLKKEVTNG